MIIIQGETGFPPDMWTASVTTFTALIFVVNFNLFTRLKYLTVAHFIAIVLCSLLPYLLYMWLSNYMSADFANT